MELASGVSECVDNLPNVKDGVTTAHRSYDASLGSSNTLDYISVFCTQNSTMMLYVDWDGMGWVSMDGRR